MAQACCSAAAAVHAMGSCQAPLQSSAATVIAKQPSRECPHHNPVVAEWLDAAVPHEPRLEGIPFGGRTGDARNRAWHEGAVMGLNGNRRETDNWVVEGDKVRLFVTNKLPEHHHHPLARPTPAAGMDGVAGLTQPAIEPGQTYVYEFEARRPGTFMYPCVCGRDGTDGDGHDGLLGHASKATEINAALSGLRPRFCFLLNAYDIEPGSAVPRV